jgi:hypothetical protein
MGRYGSALNCVIIGHCAFSIGALRIDVSVPATGNCSWFSIASPRPLADFIPSKVTSGTWIATPPLHGITFGGLGLQMFVPKRSLAHCESGLTCLSFTAVAVHALEGGRGNVLDSVPMHPQADRHHHPP